MAETPAGGSAPAGAFGIASGIVSGISAIGDMASGFINASIMREQGRILQQRADFNARMMNIEAQGVLEVADEQSADLVERVGLMVGTQRSAAAAQGVSVTSPTVAKITDETRHRARQAVIRLKNSASRQALGLRTAGEFGRGEALGQRQQLNARARYAAGQGVATGVTRMALGAAEVMDNLPAGSEAQRGSTRTPTLLERRTDELNSMNLERMYVPRSTPLQPNTNPYSTVERYRSGNIYGDEGFGIG